MNKKIKIWLFVLIIIGVVTLCLTYKNKAVVSKIKRKKQNNLAIMIKEDGATDYTKSSLKDIPKGDYVLNRDKSYCKNNGVIGDYDSTLGKVSFSFIGSDSCYLYFDVITDTEKPVISNLVVNNTTVTATLTDNESLLGYGISTSNSTEPTSWATISGTTYNLSTTITTEGTYYLWVKDSSNNKTTKEFTISLGTSFETLMVANNTNIFDENGLRYEGADPNNYICLDNKTEGTCSDSSLLFRIIGLFDEDTSSDGTSSTGTKKLLKILDTNNYGGTSGKLWCGTPSNESNNWSISALKSELNDEYFNSLKNIQSITDSFINIVVNAKWYLGGPKYSTYSSLTAEGFYNTERGTQVYGSNPSSLFAKVGLMYPSDYGYASDGGSVSGKSICKTEYLSNWNSSTYSICKDNNWIFNSSNFIEDKEWLLTPYVGVSDFSYSLYSTGKIDISGLYTNNLYAVRPTFYLDSSILKIVGGTGTSTDPYHIG